MQEFVGLLPIGHAEVLAVQFNSHSSPFNRTDTIPRSAATKRLIAAGATRISGLEVLNTADELAMLRDPWRLAIQLAKRAEPRL